MMLLAKKRLSTCRVSQPHDVTIRRLRSLGYDARARSDCTTLSTTMSSFLRLGWASDCLIYCRPNLIKFCFVLTSSRLALFEDGTCAPMVNKPLVHWRVGPRDIRPHFRPKWCLTIEHLPQNGLSRRKEVRCCCTAVPGPLS